MHKSPEHCSEAYDLWAPSYDVIDNPLVVQSSEVVASHADLFSNARVVEFGCGTGRHGSAILGFGALSYTGVDASGGMLRVARRLEDPRVTWVHADILTGAAELATRGVRFDVALICLVLEHLEDISPMVRAAASCLDVGGRLMAVELHPSMHDRGIGANFRTGASEVRLPSFRHDAHEFECACASAGLKVMSCADIEPTDAALARSDKLARYKCSAVLLEVIAKR